MTSPAPEHGVDIVERLRDHVNSRGGPAKDDAGNFVGTAWPMMLEAADMIDGLQNQIAMFGEINAELLSAAQLETAIADSAAQEIIDLTAALAAEREACAKVAENFDHLESLGHDDDDCNAIAYTAAGQTCDDIAAAIRARGQEDQ